MKTITRLSTTPANDPWYVRKNPDVCAICDSPNVSYSYPAPMCALCHSDWAE